jgi:integrase
VDGDGYYFPAVWRDSSLFDKARDAAGLPETFVPHHLRHIYASRLRLASG